MLSVAASFTLWLMVPTVWMRRRTLGPLGLLRISLSRRSTALESSESARLTASAARQSAARFCTPSCALCSWRKRESLGHEWDDVLTAYTHTHAYTYLEHHGLHERCVVLGHVLAKALQELTQDLHALQHQLLVDARRLYSLQHAGANLRSNRGSHAGVGIRNEALQANRVNVTVHEEERVDWQLVKQQCGRVTRLLGVLWLLTE